MQDASDRFEIEQRDPPSPVLQRLETNVETIIGHDWYRKIDRVVVNDLRKFRKYDGKRMRDLLRVLRNKVSLSFKKKRNIVVYIQIGYSIYLTRSIIYVSVRNIIGKIYPTL